MMQPNDTGLLPSTITLCLDALDHYRGRFYHSEYMGKNEAGNTWIHNTPMVEKHAEIDLAVANLRAIAALSAPAPEQVFTDDYYAGYAAGMQTEREHQDALSRLVMQRTPPAPEQGVDANGLLPCPHCQAGAYLYDYDTEIDMWPVRCNNTKCNAQVCSPISEADAIARWNKRTPPAPAVPAIPDEVYKALFEMVSEAVDWKWIGYGVMQGHIATVRAWLDSLQHRAASDD